MFLLSKATQCKTPYQSKGQGDILALKMYCTLLYIKNNLVVFFLLKITKHWDNPTTKLCKSSNLSFCPERRLLHNFICIVHGPSPLGRTTACRLSPCSLNGKPKMYRAAPLGETLLFFKSILLLFFDCNSDCVSLCAWVTNQGWIFTFYFTVRCYTPTIYIAAAWAKWISLNQSYCFSAGKVQWRP